MCSTWQCHNKEGRTWEWCSGWIEWRGCRFQNMSHSNCSHSGNATTSRIWLLSVEEWTRSVSTQLHVILHRPRYSRCPSCSCSSAGKFDCCLGVCSINWLSSHFHSWNAQLLPMAAIRFNCSLCELAGWICWRRYLNRILMVAGSALLILHYFFT